MTVTIVGAPSAASDVALARLLEQRLAARFPGKVWTAEPPRSSTFEAEEASA